MLGVRVQAKADREAKALGTGHGALGTGCSVIRGSGPVGSLRTLPVLTIPTKGKRQPLKKTK